MDVRLQLHVKKDPLSHADLYRNEVEKFRGMLRISKMDPQAKNPELSSLLIFLPHISMHFEDKISSDVFTYALDYYSLLEKSLAHATITGICHIKKTKQIEPEIFYKSAIPLIEEMDKRTKTTFLQFLISEIIRDKEHWPIIKEILLSAIKSGVEAHSKRAAYIFMHLVSREAWKDEETAEHVFSLIMYAPPVVVNFVFLYLLDRVELSIKEEDIEMPEIQRKMKIKKETISDRKKDERKKKEIQKKLAKREEKMRNKEPNVVVLLQRLGDKGPFFGAKIFKCIKNSEYSAELKLKMAEVVSRIACYHKITIKGFLGYMTRFLFPHQEKLPSVFATIAQSIHENTPTKEVEAICEMLVESFCNDYKDDEIIAYGINCLKIILKKYPEASKYKCIEYVLDFRRMRKKRAVTASMALKKMIRETEKAKSKLSKQEEESIEELEEDEEYNSSFSDNGEEEEEWEEASLFSDSDGQVFGSDDIDSHGFVTEEGIIKITKKSSKEEMIAKAKADRCKREKKDLPSNNKTKQKETNYTVRKTKRKSVGKKLSKKAKKVKKGGKKRS
ncbi:protein SDA1 [Nematocida sp. LUAm3]|nr:protein SDA1 [Nematocida sp. LUAm3]KAI5173790.1 protein SDA1 [Nematocida sp. LUAm2]KAI5177013.1 protein SDA1 [Nematocida sp. LUAm1]